MSWQKIFKTARRMGTPVIVTDQAGLDPMIILPLEAYEGLVGEEGPGSVSFIQDRRRTRKGGEINESIFELPPDEEMPLMDLNDLAQPSEKTQKTPDFKESEPEEGENPEISLEERFYFEPLEDETKK